MKRAQLKRLWNRCKSDPRFRRLLLAMLAFAVPSKPRDQVAACAFADFTLRKAGPTGRRELKRRLAEAGW